MPPESADLLIEARWVLPIAPVNTVLADHAVAVTSGRIVALGPIAQMNARFEPRERVVRRDHALLPGFVNAHTRAAMTLFRGLPVRGTRSRWLWDTVRAAEQRCMSPDFIREGTQLAIAEMLRAWITSFADMYSFPEEAARAASAFAAAGRATRPRRGTSGTGPRARAEPLARSGDGTRLGSPRRDGWWGDANAGSGSRMNDKVRPARNLSRNLSPTRQI